MTKVYDIFRALSGEDHDRGKLEELTAESEKLRAFVATLSSILVAKGLVTPEELKLMLSNADSPYYIESGKL